MRTNVDNDVAYTLACHHMVAYVHATWHTCDTHDMRKNMVVEFVNLRVKNIILNSSNMIFKL